MVNSPLIRPYLLGGGVALGGVPYFEGHATLLSQSGGLPQYSRRGSLRRKLKKECATEILE